MHAASVRLSAYHVISEAFTDVDGSIKRALWGTRTSQLCVVDALTWQMIRDGNVEELPPPLRRSLIDAEILTADADELQSVLAANATATVNDRTLRCVINPSAWCQLACDYCGQEHAIQTLSAGHQERLVERVVQKVERERYAAVRVAWFGGEPLAAMPVLRSLTRMLALRLEAIGVDYQGTVVTNGVALSAAISRELVDELFVRCVEVTIDGPRAVHDRRRMLKTGGSTYERVIRNVETLAERDASVEIILRCNVDRRNAEYVPQLIDELASRQLHRKVAGLYFARVHNWANDAGAHSNGAEDYARMEVQWLSQMMTLGFRTALLPARKFTNCLVLRPDAEAYDAYGNIFKCAEVAYAPAYESRPGDPLSNIHAIGHLDTEQAPTRRTRLEVFPRDVEARAVPCHSCSLFPVCGGACPKLWAEGHAPCPSLKDNAADRLLLAVAADRIRRRDEQR